MDRSGDDAACQETNVVHVPVDPKTTSLPIFDTDPIMKRPACAL